MRSATLRAPMRAWILLSTTLAAAACAGGPPIVASPSACSSLLPAEWREPVPGAPIPDGGTAGDWIQFADAQTAQLDKANDRTTSAIGIVERCEARDRDAVRRARPRFLGIF
jgi:hypothetical protein